MIKFSNVSLIYPNSTTTVLEDLNLEIAEGEMVLVIGPTGSGKSSLLRLINGLVPHHTGGILAGDVSVGSLESPQRCYAQASRRGLRSTQPFSLT